MKLAIAGGGTGGHVYPGIAIAEEICRRGGEVFFIGTAAGMESAIVPKSGYRICTLAAAPIKRGQIFQNVKALVVTLRGFFDALSILRREKPDVVLGMGGYVSFAGCIAARRIRIPVALHEQNAVSGLANRLLTGIAATVMKSWGAGAVGLPIRSAFNRISREEARKAFGVSQEARVLLVFGGSRGAASINEAMKTVIPRLCDVTVLWATGAGHYEKAAYLQSPTIRVVPYLDDMPAALAAADLAVTRAGAMTLAELAASGVPSILVPYPHATADHQTANAKAFVDAGASEMIRDAELAERLYDKIMATLNDQEKLEAMKARARTLANPGAASQIADILEGL